MRFTTGMVLGLVLSLSNLGYSQGSGSRKSSDSAKSGMRLKARAKPSETGSMAMKSTKASSKSEYTNYLPLGTGQFMQDRTVPGAVFALSQVTFLGLALSAMKNVSDANADVKSVMKDADQNVIANDPAALAYLNKNEKYVKENQANMKIFGGLALLSYGIGVVDALYNPFGSSYSMAAKKKRVSVEPKSSKRNAKSLSSENEVVTGNRVSVFYFQGEEKPGYGLQMNSEF